MSTNVYIGARYVPIFDGDWDSTKVYEPLTIVNYNGGSYTSKRAVPANTPPTNTNYWALTGNYNGQIANLQTQVNALGTRVNALETKKRKFVMIGDSYGHEYHSVEGWSTRVCSILNLSADQYILSCHNNSGFIGTISTTFETLLDSAYTTAGDDATNITDVVVAGGRNDVGVNATDLATAIQAFVTKAQTYFPNATIWLGMIGMSRLDDASVQEWLHRLEFIYYGNAQGKVAYMHNINLTGRMNTNLYQDGDYNHPNDNGQKLLAKNIATVLLGGTPQIQSYPKRTVSYTADQTITSISGDIKYTQNQNGDITLFFSNVHAQFTAGTLTRNSNLPVINFDVSVPFRGFLSSGDEGNQMPITVKFGSDYRTLNAQMYIYNGKISFKLLDSQDYSAVTDIYIIGSATIPSSQI